MSRSVYVAFEAFPRPKGSSSHIAAMVTALARRHAPVLLLCLGYADMPALQNEGNVIVRRFKVYLPNVLRRAKEFGDYVYDSLRGLKARPEILVYRDPWGGWPATSALEGCPAIFEVNALPSWELPYSYPAICDNPGLTARIHDIELHCLQTAAAVISVSHVTKEALTGLGVHADAIRVIPNSADEVFFAAGRQTESRLRGLPNRYFGYVGSLHSWQGIETLTTAWAQIAAEWPDVTLRVVHNGDRRAVKELGKHLSRLGLEGRVLLSSPLPPDELAAAVAGMEFTCAPLAETSRNTVQGCCPVKIVESMAAGTPVLASDLRVTRALIRHGVHGFLVPPGDVRAWALAIRRMLGDASLGAGLAEGARIRAQESFTRAAMFEKLDGVFESVVHGTARMDRR